MNTTGTGEDVGLPLYWNTYSDSAAPTQAEYTILWNNLNKELERLKALNKIPTRRPIIEKNYDLDKRLLVDLDAVTDELL